MDSSPLSSPPSTILTPRHNDDASQPRTPDSSKRRQRPQLHHHHVSLHHVGIGTPSPLLRQFSTFSSSPPSLPPLGIIANDENGTLNEFETDDEEGYSGEDEDDQQHHDPAAPTTQDLTQDSRDVLVQRLADLVRRLQSPAGADGTVLGELHAQVDEMETILTSGGRRAVRRPSPMQSSHRRVHSSSAVVMSRISGPPLGDPFVDKRISPARAWSMPPWLAASRSRGSPSFSSPVLPESTAAVAETQRETDDQDRDVPWRVAAEAEKLNAKIVKLAERMEARREETDHIHELLIERAEAAATRILDLEKEVADLEDEINGNESDIRHLRIELRAIETLCHESIPSAVDPELVQSIQNWKSDWATLRDKMSAKKKTRRLRQRRPGEEGSSEDLTILSASFASISVSGTQSPMF